MVEPGAVYERNSGPTLTAKVLRVEGEQAICRLYRPSGVAFGGERPVPVGLLESHFSLLSSGRRSNRGAG